jgi:hypothetical protein
MSSTPVTPAGQASQLGCVKHVFTDGFTVGVTELVFVIRENAGSWLTISLLLAKRTSQSLFVALQGVVVLVDRLVSM